MNTVRKEEYGCAVQQSVFPEPLRLLLTDASFKHFCALRHKLAHLSNKGHDVFTMVIMASQIMNKMLAMKEISEIKRLLLARKTT